MSCVAAAVALTAGLTADDALDAFHHVWWLFVISGIGVSLLTSRLPRPAVVEGGVRRELADV